MVLKAYCQVHRRFNQFTHVPSADAWNGYNYSPCALKLQHVSHVVLLVMCRILYISVSRHHIHTLQLLHHHSRRHVQAAAVQVRTHPLHLTCCEHWVYRQTYHCSALLCHRCVLGAWPGAELHATVRHCTMTSVWVLICLLHGHGRRWTHSVQRAHQTRTQLNVLPSSTAMLPVSLLCDFIIMFWSLSLPTVH